MTHGDPASDERLPARPDEALPDSTDPHGTCPRCGRLSNFTVEGHAPLTFDATAAVLAPDGRRQRVELQRLTVLQCQGCSQNVLVVEDLYVGGARVASATRMQGGRSEWKGIHWWPTPGMRQGDPAVPEQVATLVAEGVRCLAVLAPRAAAVMFRGALGQIVTSLGSEAARGKRTLAEQLKQMAEEGHLDRTVADWADHVRMLGNAAAHPNELEPVTVAEAQELHDLMGVLIDYLYVRPAQIKAARERRGARPRQ